MQKIPGTHLADLTKQARDLDLITQRTKVLALLGGLFSRRSQLLQKIERIDGQIAQLDANDWSVIEQIETDTRVSLRT